MEAHMGYVTNRFVKLDNLLRSTLFVVGCYITRSVFFSSLG